MHSHLLFNNVPLYVYLTAALASLIQVVAGSKFYRGAAAAVRQHQPNMDVLVAMSTSAAWGYGMAQILIGYSF